MNPIAATDFLGAKIISREKAVYTYWATQDAHSDKYSLANSRMSYTILRPIYLMDPRISSVFGFEYPNAKAKIRFISLGDVSFCSGPNHLLTDGFFLDYTSVCDVLM